MCITHTYVTCVSCVHVPRVSVSCVCDYTHQVAPYLSLLPCPLKHCDLASITTDGSCSRHPKCYSSLAALYGNYVQLASCQVLRSGLCLFWDPNILFISEILVPWQHVHGNCFPQSSATLKHLSDFCAPFISTCPVALSKEVSFELSSELNHMGESQVLHSKFILIVPLL